MTADDATTIVMSHRLLRRYVLPGERVVLAARWHWAKLVEPAVTAFVVLCLCGWLSFALQPAFGDGALVVWWLWFAALARFGWCLLVWRVEWFVATDKRMLLLTGLVTHQIGMMPLMKVTDMRYSRSVLGQLLGYGQFLLESAGQDQALRQINWVAHPDATYRDLCALIFTPVEAPPSDGEDDAGPAPARGPRQRTASPALAPPSLASPSLAPSSLAPSSPAPPALLPTTARGRVPVVVTDDDEPDPTAGWHDDERYAPEDTQPVRVTRRTAPHPPAPARGVPEPPAPEAAPEAAAVDDEESEPSWYVSEPTGRFVDLGSPRTDDDGDGQPG